MSPHKHPGPEDLGDRNGECTQLSRLGAHGRHYLMLRYFDPLMQGLFMRAYLGARAGLM